MLYYLLLFAYMVFVQFISRNHKGNDVFLMVITFLPLFLFGALRVNCGDYEIYEQYNSWVRSSGNNIYDVIERMEPGYAMLNKFLPYRWIIILSSLLACYAYGVLFIKLVPKQYRWFGMILFFLVGDKTFYFLFSSIRNSIAISILMLYMTYRITKREIKHSWVKELIILVAATALAYSIHASALVFFPIAFLMTLNGKVTNTEHFVWLALLVLLWIVPVDTIIGTGFFSDYEYFERYDEYLERAHNTGMLAKMGATIFALLCLVDIRNNSDRRDSVVSRLALIFVYSYLLGGLNIRTSQYYVIFIIVYLVGVYIDRNKTAWSMALLAFAIVFLFYSSFVAGTFGSAIYSPFVNYRISLSV